MDIITIIGIGITYDIKEIIIIMNIIQIIDILMNINTNIIDIIINVMIENIILKNLTN